ncbi:uncharacterized protein LOC115633727 [Scaptodrosophila lebanonensis]|uniref:Uncharacterized protein LOC115633727 n=1 Tax=Drosophila lebanonensis TaxID=7225 RepID=A0A6J2UF74_DROLE|nr:uncharacterized protein LOC115633727 [Scaptodrosophila lebanonensis]
MKALESELETFFEQCRQEQFSAQEMSHICQPLLWRLGLVKIRRWVLCALPLLLIYLLWQYSESFAWSVSAVGRMLLIQILPYWDWTPYYSSKCLIERNEDIRKRVEAPRILDKYETHWENCALCESLENIPTLSNVSYSIVESQFLERGLPVIITDAQVQSSLDDVLELIQHKAPALLASKPCDVSTNLLLQKLFNIDAAIQKIRTLHEPKAWHLQFRNCEFKAVKASRLYVHRPYYYPVHLEPYYSSWLLMAHKSERPQSNIYLRGLIFVQQLSGHFDVRLRPKHPCDDNVCPTLRIRLHSGECIVFSTDLWRFSYGLQKPDPSNTSIATILEVDWNL